MSESEISVEYEVCLKLLPTQLANIGATSHVKNNLNIIRVRHTTQNQKPALAYALLFQKLCCFGAYTEVTAAISIFSLLI